MNPRPRMYSPPRTATESMIGRKLVRLLDRVEPSQ
jgi:hypothetical protein